MKTYIASIVGVVVLCTGIAQAQTGSVELQVSAETSGSASTNRDSAHTSDSNASAGKGAKGADRIQVGIEGSAGEAVHSDNDTSQGNPTGTPRDVKNSPATNSEKEIEPLDDDSDEDGRMGNAVSIAAVEVRGWDPKQKQEFLATVKAHAEVKSGQDLENFAKGVVLKDERVEEVELSDEKISVQYHSRGKLFGFFTISYKQRVDVDVSGQDAGKVSVVLPWYAFVLTPDVDADDIEEEFLISRKGYDGWISSSTHARALADISLILRTKHDTAKNSINNVR